MQCSVTLHPLWWRILAALFIASPLLASTDDVHGKLFPILEKHCVGCHGRDKTKGGVDLNALTKTSQFVANPKLLASLVEVIESAEMPPEPEPILPEAQRASILAILRQLLAASTANLPLPDDKPHRLNRFQYNNAVKDLFELSKDIFALPEKLMTRHDGFLGSQKDPFPNVVSVSCDSFRENTGFRGLDPFPKDLRAAHGFDNQSNQLTLSPLLLDAFLKLSVSLFESPDFNPDNVGVWHSFFSEPNNQSNLRQEIETRLQTILRKAFRSNPSAEILSRYRAFTEEQISRGATFTEAMKKVGSAILSSPLFLLQYPNSLPTQTQLTLASKLSFFLWGSAPDDDLLRLAHSGKLLDRATLNQTFDRMLADKKIERFLDAFPAQWLQLENILGAAPDRQKYRLYSLDPNAPAGAQMILEPLLLFDAVFIENRPVVDLIFPDFSYRSEFLQEWYTSDFKPAFNAEKLAEKNRSSFEQRSQLSKKLAQIHTQRASLLTQIRDRIAEGVSVSSLSRDSGLKPYAAWDFNHTLRDSIGELDLESHGSVSFEHGCVVLDEAFLESKPLPIELREKTLEVWIQLPPQETLSGAVMGIQAAPRFDSIALAQRPLGRWFSNSEALSRSKPFEIEPEESFGQPLHLVAVYHKDGTTQLHRNGVSYGARYNKGVLSFPKGKSTLLFGANLAKDIANRLKGLRIEKARLYDRALTSQEVASAYAGEETAQLLAKYASKLSPSERDTYTNTEQSLASTKLLLSETVDYEDPATVLETAQKDLDTNILNLQRSRTFRRVPVEDKRYGGVITNAAVLTMTSGPKRTLPIARGSWMVEVIFNDPPAPPPNNVPPLNEGDRGKNLTIREQFAQHRENPDCASCHSRIDPLGFALENFDSTGRWRNIYENGRAVDPSGIFLRKNAFKDVVELKTMLHSDSQRFAKAFAAHLLRFAVARELTAADTPSLERILKNTADSGFRVRDLLREVILSESFLRESLSPSEQR